MDPLWSETCWSTFKYFIILIVSTYYILWISWIIKCLFIIDARCKHELWNFYGSKSIIGEIRISYCVLLPITLSLKTKQTNNNRCSYQSVTQQYLKRCLIKDDSNYMFRPIAAIIRFSSEYMVVVLYRIGMGMSRCWDLFMCDICYITNITDAEIPPSWHTHTNSIKHYHHTFGWKPDDGRNRPKHVVTILLY